MKRIKCRYVVNLSYPHRLMSSCCLQTLGAAHAPLTKLHARTYKTHVCSSWVQVPATHGLLEVCRISKYYKPKADHRKCNAQCTDPMNALRDHSKVHKVDRLRLASRNSARNVPVFTFCIQMQVLRSESYTLWRMNMKSRSFWWKIYMFSPEFFIEMFLQANQSHHLEHKVMLLLILSSWTLHRDSIKIISPEIAAHMG